MQPLSKFPSTIKTARLVLKTVDATDENAKKFLDIINQNRDYLQAWQGHFEYLNSVDDVKRKLAQRKEQQSQNECVLFGIYHNDAPIGRIRFFHIDGDKCEIGYWLIQSVNGNGYLTEALTALESELFKFGFNRIVLDIDDGNVKSENVAKRNGYKLEQRLPMASWAKSVGKCDSLIYVKHR